MRDSFTREGPRRSSDESYLVLLVAKTTKEYLEPPIPLPVVLSLPCHFSFLDTFRLLMVVADRFSKSLVSASLV